MKHIKQAFGYIILAIVLLALAVFIGNWLGKKKNNAPPGFELTSIPSIFVKDRIIDVGMISPHLPVEVTFDLFNSSEKTYIVKRIAADCGCVTADLTDKKLTPNKHLPVKAKIDPSLLSGSAFQKKILVELLQQGQEEVLKDMFAFKGMIDRTGTLLAWPGILDFGNIVADSNSSKTFYLKADNAILDKIPDLIETKYSSEVLIELSEIEYKHKTGAKAIKVNLSIPKDSPKGIFKSSIVVKVDDSPPKSITIPIKAKVDNDIMINPNRLYMTIADNETSTSVNLTLSSVTGKQLDIKEISSFLPIQWSVKCHTKNDRTLLGITITPKDDINLDKTLRGDIQIDLNNTKYVVPIVLVPVYINSKNS